MQTTILNKATLAMAAMGLSAFATPAMAAPLIASPAHHPGYAAPLIIHSGALPAWEHSRDRGRYDRWNRGRSYNDRYDRRGYNHRVSYGEPVHSRTKVWRGNDGRYYCRKDNGTTGLLIGAAVGGLAGHEIAGHGDKTLGAILGVVGGGLLGRAIDRSNASCR